MAQKIRIISKREGFRRGGIAHPEAPTLYDLDAFTADELAALRGEPMLVVDVVEADEAGTLQVVGVPAAEGKSGRQPKK